MQFDNPVVGGTELIREAIQSDNYVAGVTGWRIARDGTSQITDLSILNSLGVSDITTDTLSVGGQDIATEISQLPVGTWAYSNFQSGTNTASIGTTETVCFQGKVGQVYAARLYRVSLKGHLQISAAGVAVDIRIRYTIDGSTPTTSSNILRTYRFGSNNTSEDFDMFKYYSPAIDYDNWNFCITLQVANSGTADIYMGAADRSLEFAMDDMGLYANVSNGALMQVSGTTSGGGTTTYTKTWSANGSASFDSSGTNRSGYDNGHMYQGEYSSTNGNQFSLATFDYSAIQSALSGATITKTEVYLHNLFWYYNSGGTAVIGTHTYASVSGNANYSNVTPNITQSSFTVGQSKWVTVNNSIGNALKNNTAKGIALGKGPSTSKTYYGYFAGNGQSGEPQIRITYTK